MSRNNNKFNILIIILSVSCVAHSWKYQTKCTKTAETSSLIAADNSYSIVDDFESIRTQKINDQPTQQNKMTLKCPNSNDFLFIGQTQYGVSVNQQDKATNDCRIQPDDCLVSVDYLASQCNGLNLCDIQLDAQFLHSCKNLSDYLSIAYECIPGSKTIDICSNEETFVIDSTYTQSKNDLNTRFGSFYLASPNYPWEYDSNANNCSCRLEYVEIEGTLPVDNEMNLAIKAYEFDLEEGENNKCNKDSLKIEGKDGSLDLCGQHKDFKQFFTKGQSVKLNFTTDDVITRRGFLLEIAPVSETVCPIGTTRFNENKCVKYYDNQYLTHKQASKACKRNQGKLLRINDFVDNSKLTSFIHGASVGAESSSWADFILGKKTKNLNFLNLKKRRHTTACVSRKANFWTEESCYTKLPYICEFEAINVNRPASTVNKKNRLIRVSCGDLTNKFSNVKVKTTTTSTTTTTPQAASATKEIKIDKPVLLWSSLIENFPNNKAPVEVTSTKTKTLNKFDAFLQSDIENQLVQNSEEVIDTESTDKITLNQNLILIIAIVSGAIVVFIIINIFCIWNYYNKKLNAFIEKSDPENSAYRTSTMRSSTRNRNYQHNKSLSTVDSYVKILPYSTETCLLNTDSSSAGSTSPNQSDRLENELKLDILRNYFHTKKLENQMNFYETISSQGFNYQANELNQNSINQILAAQGATNTSIDSINSAVQHILNQQLQQQLYDQCVYSDISPTLSMNSQRPLITFVSNNSNNNNQKTVVDSSAAEANSKLLPASV